MITFTSFYCLKLSIIYNWYILHELCNPQESKSIHSGFTKDSREVKKKKKGHRQPTATVKVIISRQEDQEHYQTLFSADFLTAFFAFCSADGGVKNKLGLSPSLTK